MRTRTLLGTAALALLLAAPAVRANPCIDGAVAEYRDCKSDCREAFQVAKDACLNRDHVCVEACRAGREDCVDATGFEADLDACAAAREVAVGNCRDLYPAGDARDQCIDNAQLDAFKCRDQAREQNADELAACRAGFKGCADDCPPADPSDPPIDRPACRRSAKQDFKACQATCREDFQITKDACRNRDHACVETCRDDRNACRQPILDQLEADIAADCNAPRDAAIAQCHANFPPDSTELDGCIDQAQAVAFQCRDGKREAAHPALELCRTGFRSCVLACPPPS
jgi:hypothetical protein